MGRVDIINSTLGKALGGAAGGYTTGPHELIDLLKQKSRPYLFSNTLPPAVVASASKVIDLLMHSSEYPERVQRNTERFRSKMIAAGFIISGCEHAICPVMLGEAKLATVFADEMLSKNEDISNGKNSKICYTVDFCLFFFFFQRKESM